MPNVTQFVKIEDLDDIGEIIFRGVTHLNTIQSIVFPTAYTTNENMLICAPTGAGKTNIALLTIAHQIRQHTNNGIVDHSQFKVNITFTQTLVNINILLNLDCLCCSHESSSS